VNSPSLPFAFREGIISKLQTLGAEVVGGLGLGKGFETPSQATNRARGTAGSRLLKSDWLSSRLAIDGSAGRLCTGGKQESLRLSKVSESLPGT
jgi:hypothetical protein